MLFEKSVQSLNCVANHICDFHIIIDVRVKSKASLLRKLFATQPNNFI